MAQNTGRTNGNGRNNGYIYGNVAPKIDIRHEIEDDNRRVRRENPRKSPLKKRSLSPAYIMVFLVCMCATMAVIMWYVNLRSLMNSKVTMINRMEAQLNTKRQENDEEKLRIENSIDLEEIKRIAIGELGMIYPEEGQIITYSGEGTDYMRKVVED